METALTRSWTISIPEPLSAGSVDGLLGVDKPTGWTSHDVVDFARKRLAIRKVGHTGTLDPLATGVLVLCVGRATRLSVYLSGLDKEYDATVRLGVRTDTLDADGQVIADESGSVPASVSDVEAMLEEFRGTIHQVPPMYSARKVGGRKLYELARKGQEIEREARPVTIHSLEAVAYDPPDLRLRVQCSSGTYIRVLADDLGNRLGCGGHIVELRRTRVGSVTLEACPPVDELERRWEEDGPSGMMINPGIALGHLREFPLDSDQLRAFQHGNPVVEGCPTEGFGGGELVRATDPEGELVGIGKWLAEAAALQPVRVLRPAEG